jgi:hypothetical protein
MGNSNSSYAAGPVSEFSILGEVAWTPRLTGCVPQYQCPSPYPTGNYSMSINGTAQFNLYSVSPAAGPSGSYYLRPSTAQSDEFWIAGDTGKLWDSTLKAPCYAVNDPTISPNGYPLECGSTDTTGNVDSYMALVDSCGNAQCTWWLCTIVDASGVQVR